MAAITSSDVTVLGSYHVGDRSGKFYALRQYLSIELSAQGGTAGDIPASALGLKQITFAQGFGGLVSSTNVVIPVGVSTPGTDDNYIYPINVEDATDASRGNAANITGTLYVMVEGIPASS